MKPCSNQTSRQTSWFRPSLTAAALLGAAWCGSLASAQNQDASAGADNALGNRQRVGAQVAPFERKLPLHLREQDERLLDYRLLELAVPEVAGEAFTVQLPFEGELMTLDFNMHSVRTNHFEVLHEVAEGVLESVEPGPVTTLRGTVREDKDAAVVGALLSSGFEATVILPDSRSIHIEPHFASAEAGVTNRFAVYWATDSTCAPASCELSSAHMVSTPGASGSYAGTVDGCGGDFCVAELALDLDRSFYNQYADATTAQEMAEYIVNVANIQYERDVQIQHRLTTVIVRTNAQPASYSSASNFDELLDAFTAHWNSVHGSVVRDTAHLLTERFAGGLAWVGTVCNLPFGYGVSGVQGSYGVRCYANIVAHELGHNWNAGHCACSGSPDITSDYTMNPSYPPCPLRFHPTETIPEIKAYRDAASCLDSGVINDTCANAMELTPGIMRGTVVGATQDGTTNATGTSGADVWYTYQPASNGTLTLATCDAYTDFDTVLSIHSGCVGTGGNEIASNDQFCGDQSQVSTAVTAGEVYLIRVAGWSNASGIFQLDVTGPASMPPLNDAWQNAMHIGPGTYYQNTDNANVDGSTTCDSAAPDVWYVYTPYFDQIVTVDTCGVQAGNGFGSDQTQIDTVLSVHSMSHPSPNSAAAVIACNDQWCNNGSRVEWDATAGTTYLIRAAGWTTNSGPFALSLSGSEVRNDFCNTAMTIDEGTYLVSLNGAFASDGESTCGSAATDVQPDLWYRFVAPGSGDLSVSSCGTHDLAGVDSGTDTVLSVHSACPGNDGSQLACNDDSSLCTGQAGFNYDSFVSLPMTAGQVVRIRATRRAAFAGSNGGGGRTARDPFFLHVDFTNDPPPNDNCSNATAIGNGTFFGTLNGATNDGEQSCASATGNPDVWYRYTASCSGRMTVTTCGTHDAPGTDLGMDTVLSVHSNFCSSGAGNQIACNDDFFGNCGGLATGVERDSGIVLDVCAGETYLIRVTHWGSAIADGEFRLNVSCTPGAIGMNYCATNPNSTGLSGRISAIGCPDASANNVVLVASDCPPNRPGIFFYGPGTLQVPLGDGFLCVGGFQQRSAAGRARGAPRLRAQAAQARALRHLRRLPGQELGLVRSRPPTPAAAGFSFRSRPPTPAAAGVDLLPPSRGRRVRGLHAVASPARRRTCAVAYGRVGWVMGALRRWLLALACAAVSACTHRNDRATIRQLVNEDATFVPADCAELRIERRDELGGRRRYAVGGCGEGEDIVCGSGTSGHGPRCFPARQLYEQYYYPDEGRRAQGTIAPNDEAPADPPR